jgi:hypothetical protein
MKFCIWWITLKSFILLISLALALASLKAGTPKTAKRAIIATTTRSSMRVNERDWVVGGWVIGNWVLGYLGIGYLGIG